MKKIFITAVSVCLALVLSACDAAYLNGAQRTADIVSSAPNVQSSKTSSIEFDLDAYIAKKEGTEDEDSTASDRVRGKIFDRNGSVLVYSEPNGEQEYIRLFDEDYAEAVAPFVSDVSNGVDCVNAKTMRKPNNTSTPNDCGRSIKLTLDADLQLKIYRLMCEKNAVGSVVIMDKNGAVICAVSTPSYDPNRYGSDPSYAAEINKAANTPLICKANEKRTPGSTFKMISCTLAKKYGYTTYFDRGSLEVNGQTIKNWDHDAAYYPVERDLRSLFFNSSNTGFAYVFMNTSKDRITTDCKNMFLLGDNIDFECDFAALHNDLKLTDIARSGFGQSDVKLSPMYTAMLAILTATGEMPKPYCVAAEVNTLDCTDVIEERKIGDPLSTIEYKLREPTVLGMQDIAENLGLSVSVKGANIYAKTGTAEFDSVQNTLWIAGYISLSEKSGYAVVLQIRNPDDLGFEYASDMREIYQEILNDAFK